MHSRDLRIRGLNIIGDRGVKPSGPIHPTCRSSTFPAISSSSWSIAEINAVVCHPLKPPPVVHHKPARQHRSHQVRLLSLPPQTSLTLCNHCEVPIRLPGETAARDVRCPFSAPQPASIALGEGLRIDLSSGEISKCGPVGNTPTSRAQHPHNFCRNEGAELCHCSPDQRKDDQAFISCITKK